MIGGLASVWLAGALFIWPCGCSKPSATEAQPPKPAGNSTPQPITTPSQAIDTSEPSNVTEPAAVARPAKPQSPPPIVIILVDTLRADRLGVYGNSRGLTKTMDRWASEGVLFEQAIAPAPWTLPSVASLFTGFYPPVHGANAGRYTGEAGTRSRNWRRGIPAQMPTFIESLNDAGYQTYGISTNNFIQRKTGFARGFYVFQNRAARGRRAATRVNQDLAQMFKRMGKAKQRMLYVHYMDVHEPYMAKPKYIDPLLDELIDRQDLTPVDNPNRGIYREAKRRFGKDERHAQLMPYIEYWEARYDGGVKQLDVALDQLERILRSVKLWERAWVILLADHGEALGEDDTWSHGGSTRWYQLHVPLVMRWPNYLPAGKRIAAPVSLVDVFPTLFDALEIEHPQQTQGHSLLPLIFGDQTQSQPVFAAGVKRRPNEYAVVDGRWKLRFDPDDELVALYDLQADPHETRNLARENESQLLALEDRLGAHWSQNELLKKAVKHETGAITSDELRKLQALGYLGEDEDPNVDPNSAMRDANEPNSKP